MKKIDLAFSTCPNDTFIFHAMLNGLVDTKDYAFGSFTSDVEELNRLAFQGAYPVTKLSYHAYLLLKEKYLLLESGSALGHGCGPLLVAKTPRRDFDRMKIAIPGRYTTAYLLLRLWMPSARNIVEARFDEIMEGVSGGGFDAGLIIHEGRFVYPNYGLRKIVDLGEWWEEETGSAIPLGCIALRRDRASLENDMNAILKSSVAFARNNPEASRSYVKSLAQEMDDAVIAEHIGLYVNDFTVALGVPGRKAVDRLEKMAKDRGVI